MPTRPLTTSLSCLLALTILVGAAQPAAAMMESPERILHRAYFAEYAVEDCGEALALYRRATQSGLPDDLQRIAETGAERCRDRLAAADFSTLMPPDVLAYAELRRPGELLKALSDMLGLTPASMRALLDQRRDANAGTMVHVPQRLALSPSLIDAFSQFGGAAICLTEMNFSNHQPQPRGVIVIHHGDHKLMKGIIETAFQFAPTGEKIAGLPTLASPVPQLGGVAGVLTEGLFVLGNDRTLVEGCIARLTGRVKDTLRERSDLQEVFAERGDRTFFAFADLNRIYRLAKEQVPSHDRDDLEMANRFLDLDHLQWATFSFGANDKTLGLTARLRYADDHRSIVYNLLRLPPMSRDVLKYVPDDAAAIVGLGLNPALASIAAGRAEQSAQVTGLDIPREIFGNIREIAAFVVPGPAGRMVGEDDPLPNAGIVISSNDVTRSRALWHELLRLPGLANEDGAPIEPKSFKLSDADVTSYFIPELGNVYLTELDNAIAVGLTRRALRSAIQAKQDGRSVVTDEAMKGAFEKLPASCGMMVVGHLGRLAEVGGGMNPEPEFAMVAGPAAQLCRRTTFWVGLGQSPTELSLSAALMGLPDANEALSMLSPLFGGHAQTERVQIETAPPAHAIKVEPEDQENEVEEVTTAL